MEFDIYDECVKCKKLKYVSKTGICASCLNTIREIRKSPELKKRRLGELAQAENGVRLSVRNEMRLRTNQSSPIKGINLNRVMAARDKSKAIQAAQDEEIQAFIYAAAEQLTEARNISPVVISFQEVNAELIKYLAAKPENFHALHPRKYEEVICEILRDQGHSVELTQQTRDGGKDLVVVMNTSLGKILVIVECKRWAPDRPVGTSIVERFLHVIREKSRANCGLIVATTHFTSGAIKTAQKFEYQLQLRDMKSLVEMAKQYGKWRKNQNSSIWEPNY